jgi:hypothetical protein
LLPAIPNGSFGVQIDRNGDCFRGEAPAALKDPVLSRSEAGIGALKDHLFLTFWGRRLLRWKSHMAVSRGALAAARAPQGRSMQFGEPFQAVSIVGFEVHSQVGMAIPRRWAGARPNSLSPVNA